MTCCDRNCLVLFQSTTILDRVPVGFINASEVSNSISVNDSTVLSLNDTFGGYVVVYSWNRLETIFEGEVSLVRRLDQLNSTCKCLCRLSQLIINYSSSSLIPIAAAPTTCPTAPTTPPTSDPQTDPPPPRMESLLTSVIAGELKNVCANIITLSSM